MKRSERENLLSMVRGESERIMIIPFGDGTPISVRKSEVRKLMREDQNYLFMLGSRPETRDDILRNSPCLCRQNDGDFVALNVNKPGSVYLVE